MNIDKINQNLRKMKRSVIFMENHVNNFFELNQHYNHSKINPIFVRNVQYVNNVLQIVKDNVNFMKKLDRNVPENRFIMKKKFIISLILMKHLDDITSKNSFEDIDFEVENILNTTDKIPKFLAYIPESYHEPVLEEFEHLKKNQKIIEGFSLSSLGKVFGFIASAFKMIINGVVEIGKFIGTMLIKFVMLMWKLLMMVMNLIFKVIPKLIKGIFNFIRLLFMKLIKVGIFSMLVFVILILVFTKYMMVLTEMPMPDPTMAIAPAFVITLYLFWSATDFLWRTQMAILNGIIWIFTGPIKTLIATVLGFPKDDRFFRYKGNNIAKKALLFLAMFISNFAMILIRFFISLLVIKYTFKHAVPKFIASIPTLKEIMVFPLIIGQWLYIFLKRILKFILGKVSQ
tara:strand:- start:428 stop:1630 length:1203 start_codon:yes stop_codon:yes gene_type:complete